MSPLPMTVVGGYLGAGKTTLINRLLSSDHGLRILVLVNDFGAINIDAGLLVSADEDTIELANGCVCCTMGADLFLAVGDALDRRPRPDHLIIEASGIADPLRIATVARAEPDLDYAGIVTVVDGAQIDAMIADALIAPQVCSQIACADCLVVSKTGISAGLKQMLAEINPRVVPVATGQFAFADILLPDRQLDVGQTVPHPAYTTWCYSGMTSFERDVLSDVLTNRPESLYRVKGQVRGAGSVGYLVQVAGLTIEITEINQPETTQLLGIGLAAQISPEDCARWWQTAAPPG